MLDLQPHPEGGHFGEVYRSSNRVSERASGIVRNAGTAIYFLLGAGEFSRWHVVRWDEVWHFYEGGPLELLTIDPTDMTLRRRILGPAREDRKPILTVPGGHWQAARPLDVFTLAGCTVAPGFDFEDLAFLRDDEQSRILLAERYPSLSRLL